LERAFEPEDLSTRAVLLDVKNPFGIIDPGDYFLFLGIHILEPIQKPFELGIIFRHFRTKGFDLNAVVHIK
jgi:hypothetical protein